MITNWELNIKSDLFILENIVQLLKVKLLKNI